MVMVVLLSNVIAIFNVLLFHHVLNIVVAFVMIFLSCVLVCFIMLHGFQVLAFALIFFWSRCFHHVLILFLLCFFELCCVVTCTWLNTSPFSLPVIMQTSECSKL
jgi:hypothetical protein